LVTRRREHVDAFGQLSAKSKDLADPVVLQRAADELQRQYILEGEEHVINVEKRSKEQRRERDALRLQASLLRRQKWPFMNERPQEKNFLLAEERLIGCRRK
jgi:hypothetical protein